MLNLMLLRHGKSSWSNTGLSDFERPLTDRGLRAARAMGRYLASNDLVPQLVVCSPAKRARETWEILSAAFPTPPIALVVPELYDFGDGAALLACLRQKSGSAQSVLLVGHNPSIEGLARSLVGKGSNRLRQLLGSKYPTATLCVIDFELENWADLSAGSGTLLRFVRPRDLTEADGN